ncbi:MAG TPA: TonB-dependent receptor [Allosphingosinicella sp.]
MKKFGLLGTSAIRSAAFVGFALAAAAPAYAQSGATGGGQPVTADEANACADLPTATERDACLAAQARPEGTPDEAGDPATAPVGETAERQAETDTIVVTGSRIRRNAFNTPDPLTVIDPELELKSGRSDTAEILQSSPVAAGSFQITDQIAGGQFVTNGGVGAQTLSLRGLGAERTLVLLNGRRAGPAGTRGSIAGFDLNVIPSAAIQSVEILKSGASSIYGSDAIAGVVNLLTRKSTDGLDLRMNSSVPLRGGGESYGVSAAYGKDFGRGYFIAGVDYNHRNELERGDRDYFICSEERLFNRNGDRVDILDPRTGQPRCQGGLLTGYLGLNANLTISASPQGNILSSLLQFDPALGAFLPRVTNSATLNIPNGFFPANFSCPAARLSDPATLELCRNSVGLLNNSRPNPLTYGSTVIPKLDRYTAFAQAGFNVTDNIELVGELLYNKRKTQSQNARQLFFNQFSGQTFGTTSNNTPFVQCNIPSVKAANPFCDPTGTGDPLNRQSGFAGNFIIQPVIGVPTYNATEVDYMRGVVGVKTNLSGLKEGWILDTYVQYSRSDGDYTNSRIFTDAIETQSLRTRLCKPGEVTRIRGVPCMDINFTDPRVLAGNFTPQEQAYLFGEETGNTLYTQLTAEASLAGDLFNLPAGPVGAAVGVQYRRDKIDDTPGPIALAQNVFGQSVAGRTAGFAISKEAFAEVEVPLIHNTPFIESLNLSAAGRVVNTYAERDPDGASDSNKGNWTYKVGLNWQVNDWLRFRGSYGTSFRSPALFEQFLANQTGFQGQTAIDPCVRFGQGVANGSLPARVGERCAALGIPEDFAGAGGSATIIQGGGVGVLDPETSSSKNFSVVLTPKNGLWGGMRFSVAVDYFDIKVKGQITSLGAGNIVFACLNSDNFPEDPACSLFTRDVSPSSPARFMITEVRDPFLNINQQRNRGVDITARVTQDLGRFGSLSLLGQATWQLEDRFVLFRGFESDNNNIVGEPDFVGDLKATYTNGSWSLFYGVNMIGGTSNEQALRNARGGVCFVSALRGGEICPVFELKPTFYHTASLTRDIGKRFSFTMGVSNIFDTNPPPVSGSFGPISTLGQAPVFGTQFDLIGRRAFVSVRAKM